jgi:hypothetical protein
MSPRSEQLALGAYHRKSLIISAPSAIAQAMSAITRPRSRTSGLRAVASAILDGEIVDTCDWKRTRQEAPMRHSRARDATRLMIARAERKTGGRCAAAGVVCAGIVLRDRIMLALKFPGATSYGSFPILCRSLGLECVAVQRRQGGGTGSTPLASARQRGPSAVLEPGTGVAAAVLVGGHILLGAAAAVGGCAAKALSTSTEEAADRPADPCRK